MKYFLTLTTIAIASLSSLANSKEIAITFDDSPRFARGYFDGQVRADKLIKNLKDHNVKEVAFYSVSKQLDEEGTKRLNKYAAAGHIIANHTHTHPNFNKVTFNEYKEDFLKADKELSKFQNFKKWFRFPYLREGHVKSKRDNMRKLLKDTGYINTYITLNNDDWHIETLFQRAIASGEKLDFEKMKKFYVNVLMESIEFYDNLAQNHLGRSPKHVLLLHEMDISALYIGDLVNELRRKGWTIITPTEAYKDDIANYETKTLFSGNPGRIGEIARDSGVSLKDLWHESCDEKYLNNRFKKEVLGK